MNVLLLGSGGREHTFCWKMAQSKRLNGLYIAPGNAGTLDYGENVDININDFAAIEKFVIENQINMVVVGPEEPLVNGVVDYFKSKEQLKNVMLIGPSKAGAMLEGSKDFSKQFMGKYNIPTARYKSFDLSTINDGYSFLESLKAPYVLKADGLAAGKGVIILNNLQEAKNTLQSMLNGQFGKSSSKVVIEEFLRGIELSVFVLTDGKSYVILPEAKDYKRAGEGDTGLNTGGMGAVSPVPFADGDFMAKVEEKIIKPTIKGLLNEGIHYSGFVFFGLMNVNGEPFVIEYNVRMGDPETEVVFPRIKNDILDLFEATATGKLDTVKIDTDKRSAVTVMLVSKGYPGDFEKGKVIKGLESIKYSTLFHAGTRYQNNDVVTSGGRVLAVTSYGNNLTEARNISVANAAKILFENKFFRGDIGYDLI